MKLLFIGQTWKGSSARSLREGLTLLPDVAIDEVGEDHYSPNGRSLVVRGANRLLKHFYQNELKNEIQRKMAAFKPDVLLVYKGALVAKETVLLAKSCGVFTANVFPDYSPHAYGRMLHEAMGEYDLVISTKPFHPTNWSRVYGYQNPCVFVPHGYDPEVHYWSSPPEDQDIDLVLAASWRPQYEKLMVDLSASLDTKNMSVVLAGNGWHACRSKFPGHWQFPGGLFGRSYGEFLRRGKIVIAPVNSEVVISGKAQPGDVDTTRTYELAAAYCFFLHFRTPYLQTIYSDVNEVPLWCNVNELANLIRKYLPLESERLRMATAAHERAVPDYAIPSRARQVFDFVKRELEKRNGI